MRLFSKIQYFVTLNLLLIANLLQFNMQICKSFSVLFRPIFLGYQGRPT